MIGERLRTHGLDVVKRNLGKNENYDWVNLSVGWMEGCGKTDLGVQICKYVDPNYSEENMVVNPKDFIPKIKSLPPGSAIHVIEGADVFYAQEGSMKQVRENVKFLTKCRHPYHKFIQIDIPNLFLLTWYVRAHRARSLIRILKRGWFWTYDRDKMQDVVQDAKTRRIYWGKPNFKDGWTKCTGDMQKLYDTAERLKAEEGERQEEEPETKRKGISMRQIIDNELNNGLKPDEIAKKWGYDLQYCKNEQTAWKKGLCSNK